LAVYRQTADGIRTAGRIHIYEIPTRTKPLARRTLRVGVLETLLPLGDGRLYDAQSMTAMKPGFEFAFFPKQKACINNNLQGFLVLSP
jgi:hypothetical protein